MRAIQSKFLVDQWKEVLGEWIRYCFGNRLNCCDNDNDDYDDNNNINDSVPLRALHYSPSSSSSSRSLTFLSSRRWRPQTSNINKNRDYCLSSNTPLWTINTPIGYGVVQLHFVIEGRLQKSERRSYVQKGASVTGCSKFHQQKVCATLYTKLNS